MNRTQPKDLTVGQIAKGLRVAPRTVSRWVDDGRIKGYRLPPANVRAEKAHSQGDRRVPIRSLLAFLEASRMPVPDVFQAFVETRVLLVGCTAGDTRLLGDVLTGCKTQNAAGLFDAGQVAGQWQPNVVVFHLGLGRECCRPAVAVLAQADKPPRLVALVGDDVDPAAVLADGYAAVVQIGSASPGMLAEAIRGGGE